MASYHRLVIATQSFLLDAQAPSFNRQSPICDLKSQGSAQFLFALDGLEQRLEVPLAETLTPAALDHLEEQRRAVRDRLREDLQHVPLVVAVHEDAEFRQLADVL